MRVDERRLMKEAVVDGGSMQVEEELWIDRKINWRVVS